METNHDLNLYCEDSRSQIEKNELTLDAEATLDILKNVDKRFYDILIGRYFNRQTLREVGEKFGFTGEYIRQLEPRALESLRRICCKLNLKSFE